MRSGPWRAVTAISALASHEPWSTSIWATTGESETPYDLLTARQREVLQLLAEGNNTKNIAHVMTVSTKTVEAHCAQLMDRLGIHDVAGLVRYAIR